MLQLQAMKLPRTRNSWTERLLIDDAFDACLEWRDESAGRRTSSAAATSRDTSAASQVRNGDVCPSKTRHPGAEHRLERSAS